MKDDRSFNAALLEVVERERRLMAEQFHDTLCPSLVGIALLAKLLLRRSQAGKPIDPAELGRICDYLTDAVDSSRAPFLGQAVSASKAGLMQALDELARSTAKRIACRFTAKGKVGIADGRAARVLYRIAEEGIRQAIREMQAKEISISLARQKERVTMVLRCQGGKAAPATEKEKQDHEMWRRYAETADIELKIDRAPGGGMTLSCTFRDKPKAHDP